ncbi:MAG: YmdB family metallophosphoesterase [Oscillospiraceae bacterium]|nr:YmdB family metallophosphoesterase [Oscillospiraceae bacterium]
MIVKVLAVGDVCGRTGLDFLRSKLSYVKNTYGIDFTVVNGENANVVGVTPAQCEDIFRAGADVITLGTHTWTRTEIREHLDKSQRTLRPVNFAPQCPGRGWGEYSRPFGKVCVINAMGRYSLDTNTDNPFVCIDAALEDTDAKIILVDFHAEATSEKLAAGYYYEGRVSALWGTHTHVQTSDCQTLPFGTGYITDLGMTGARRSVLGIDTEQSIGKFLGDPPQRYNGAEGPGKLEGAVFEIDSETGKCLKSEAIRIF